ncbi:Fe-S cluster assembly sulfur transfer protein SufU [Thalassotalea agarivorans]|uniref:Nitrogen fixation protein NifU n=1 Tax=Thalassotalea agarivorans TaxID=349064 RepID=A0A1H9ZG06_THASX|nr:SUF system NifU family Fe-S cluster assembly protein [Thalassotalea agarivorans]SES80587.1 nitrogen fixation protein NifU [Thalassotalea agarivorans]
MIKIDKAQLSDVDLYQNALIDLHKSPYGFDVVIDENARAEGENQTCGDELVLSLNIQQGNIAQASFSGHSCAICRASAAIMCRAIEHQKISAVDSLLVNIEQLFDEQVTQLEIPETFEPLLSVTKFPVRIQCAVLPWQTLESALKEYQHE